MTRSDFEAMSNEGLDAIAIVVDERAQPTTGKNHTLVTEDSAALAFEERYAGDLLFCHTTKCWYVWSGTHWQQDKTHRAFAWAREFVRNLSEGEQDRIRYVTSKAAFASSVEKYAQRGQRLAVTAEVFDRDPFLLGTPGGTVELKTGRLRPPDPADRITRLTAVAPADAADCPRWLQFLEESTGGDGGVVRFLQQYVGYSLTGDIREHALIFVFGDGGNGKGRFLHAVTGMMGGYHVAAAMETFAASKFDRHSAELAALKGARLVTAQETERGRGWAENRIKTLTGGDAVTARFMYQNPFTYRPEFKLAIVGNNKPSLKSVDDAIRRRFSLVPFTRKPPRPDPELDAKLQAEWPGILRWAIEGCLDWQRNGLTRPAAVAAATNDYFDDQDALGQWLSEVCDVESWNTYKSASVADLFSRGQTSPARPVSSRAHGRHSPMHWWRKVAPVIAEARASAKCRGLDFCRGRSRGDAE